MTFLSISEVDIRAIRGYKSFIDDVLFSVYRFLYRNGSVLISFMIGILSGRVVNELSNPNVKTGTDLLVAMFSLSDRPLNYTTWILAVGIGGVLACRVLLRKTEYEHRYQSVIGGMLKRYTVEPLKQYDAISIDSVLTLQSCPNLNQGWALDEIAWEHQPTIFISSDEQTVGAYGEDDNLKVMLINNPSAFTDTTRLNIKTQMTLFSYIRRYQEQIKCNLDLREKLIEDLIRKGIISFPHSLCVHIIIVTQDDKVLFTKRSPKTAYYPGRWSCSIEEQINVADLKDDPIEACVKRALEEELGLDNTFYAKGCIRVLSVFLEADIMNIAFCVIVYLNIQAQGLDDIIKSMPRADYEFIESDYLDFRKLPKAIIKEFEQFTPYHPTTRYRMLMAFINRYGGARFAREFVKHLQ